MPQNPLLQHPILRLALQACRLHQPEHAFAYLWYLFENDWQFYIDSVHGLSQADQAFIASPTQYQDHPDIPALLDTNRFQHHNLATLIQARPLFTLWLLDRSLYQQPPINALAKHPITIFPNGVKQSYWLCRADPDREFPGRGQITCLRQFHPGHHMVPRQIKQCTINITGNRLVGSLFRPLLQDGEQTQAGGRVKVRVMIQCFDDDVMPRWQRNKNNRALYCRELSDPAKRRLSISRILDKAVQSKADILVLPELTVTPDLRLFIQQWLSQHYRLPEDTDPAKPHHNIKWVVAGSFHEDGPKDASHNVSVSYLGNGAPVLRQTKLCPYGRLFSNNGDDTSAFEDILPGTSIELVQTDLGLIGTPICLDFCQGSPHAVPGQVYMDLGMQFCLVPAMSKRDNAFDHAAREMHKWYGTYSSIAMQGVDARGPHFCLYTKPHKSGRIGTLAQGQLAVFNAATKPK